MPANTMNVSDVANFKILVDGKWMSTNSVGILVERDIDGDDIEQVLKRRRIVGNYFPLLVVVLVCVSLLPVLRSVKRRKSTGAE